MTSGGRNDEQGLKQKQPEQALQAYQRALKIAPNQAILHANLGNLYFDKSRYDDAMQAYARALELDPGLAKVYYNMGCLHGIQGRIKQAMAALERAFQIAPDMKQKALQDADLASVRNDPEFQRLTATR